MEIQPKAEIKVFHEVFNNFALNLQSTKIETFNGYGIQLNLFK